MIELKQSKDAPLIDLNDSWSFAFCHEAPADEYRTEDDVRRAGLTVRPAAVPGNFELDLQAAGLIGDPFVGVNALDVRKFEACHIWYWRRFAADDRPGHDACLLFEGIDCFADIFLNGQPIGSTDNMLTEHVLDVTGRLRGDNELLVHIRPAAEEATRFEYPPGTCANLINVESVQVRKAPHMYGWDIMPRIVSAGIWRAVSLACRPTERLDSAFLETRRVAEDRQTADLVLHYRASTSCRSNDSYEISVEGACDDSHFAASQPLVFEAGRLVIPVEQPCLWWPRGRGQPNLYDVTVRLAKNGQHVDELRFRHGIRTVQLDRTSVTNSNGEGEFCFRVNGERIFVRGTNWVPLDALHSRDLVRTQRALEMAEDLECNMLRCWGGNVYESDLFFDLCDQKGILVWQDFAMACALYPQDEDFQKRLAAEAQKVIRRLRQHPSLALWCGDNECDWAYGWFGRGDPNRNVLTRHVLPAILQQEDPTRPYLPSSPYVDATAYKAGQDLVPENHLWGPRGYFKSKFYTAACCHFVSEIGYHGCPAPESLRKFLSPDKVWPWRDNDEWRLHATNPVPEVNLYGRRVELMANQIRELFGQVPDTLEEFAFASQVTQAEAKKFFIERFRCGKWRRTGILWWNLLDGWPQFSDAVVDYYFTRKLAYYTIRTSQQLLCLMLGEPQDGRQHLLACNDTNGDIPIDFAVRDVQAGRIVLDGRATAAADSATRLGQIASDPNGQTFYLIEWQYPGGQSRNHYLAGSPPFSLDEYHRWLHTADLYPQTVTG
ncbi:MAG TPA: glycoside hydrolase family 2 [Phycisphaerae bacterium]|nr:glycoside hydrolase family 2 [Phycisphaerae bacterium]